MRQLLLIKYETRNTVFTVANVLKYVVTEVFVFNCCF